LTASAELYDPALGLWTTTGSLSTARFDHTATLLPNGKVLVVGGLGSGMSSLASAEIYDPANGSWSSGGGMAYARATHTATLLTDGRVLVAGGSASITATELYTPPTGGIGTGSWATTTGSLGAARAEHTAILLTDGRVLVAGGHNADGNLTSTEIFTPGSQTWSTTGKSLNNARYGHTATLLVSGPNVGKVLVAGGTNGTSSLASAELVDPAAGGGGKWTLTGSLGTARDYHSGTLLPNGKVLVAGGGSYLASAELYDPAAGTWGTLPTSLTTGRNWHTATLLPQGKVLVAGGVTSSGYAGEAEQYDPAAAAWEPADTFPYGRYMHTLTLLPDGNVLMTGGDDGTSIDGYYIYYTSSNYWSFMGYMSTARAAHTATLLATGPNAGKVLIAGGYNEGDGYLASCQLYDPTTDTWSAAGNLNTARCVHTATLLGNGKVLVAGGRTTGYTYPTTAELYDPATNTWSYTGNLAHGRVDHTAILLPSGKVLAAGGEADSFLVNAELYDPNTGRWTGQDMPHSDGYPSGQTATLLATGPNAGKVMLVGGYGGSYYTGLKTCYLYDPQTDTWDFTGELNEGRLRHSATLLSDGRVLVAGGCVNFNMGTGTDTAELYDPIAGTWSVTQSLANYRYGHKAVYLPNDKVLVAGNWYYLEPDYPQRFDRGLGIIESLRPSINTVSSLAPGSRLTLTGSYFRGRAGASGGSFNDSPTDYPVVQLRRIENERFFWVPADPAYSFSDISFTSRQFQDFQTGHCLATVFSNAISSYSKTTIFSTTNPTAVELASFTAAWDKKRVVVEWETSTEKNNLGFYLWRAEAGQDAYTRLTQNPIPARGTATMGAAYSYADYAVVRGREYLYKLEDVDRNGTSTFHGPLPATAGHGNKTKKK
jgi:N-acetylneuraminic acid mutarotase